MAIDISDIFMNGLNKEINTFTKTDEEIREFLVGGAKIIGIERDLPRLNVTLNNKVKLFLSESRRKGLLFPTDVLIANDLCLYLEHLFYEKMNKPMDELGEYISEYNKSGYFKRLINYRRYIESLVSNVSTSMNNYASLDNEMFYFDINRDGDRVLNFALDSNKGDDTDILHKIIDCHETFHKKMNNPKMLEYIDVRRTQIK